jgi:hypothetical protein
VDSDENGKVEIKMNRTWRIVLVAASLLAFGCLSLIEAEAAATNHNSSKSNVDRAKEQGAGAESKQNSGESNAVPAPGASDRATVKSKSNITNN